VAAGWGGHRCSIVPGCEQLLFGDRQVHDGLAGEVGELALQLFDPGVELCGLAADLGSGDDTIDSEVGEPLPCSVGLAELGHDRGVVPVMEVDPPGCRCGSEQAVPELGVGQDPDDVVPDGVFDELGLDLDAAAATEVVARPARVAATSSVVAVASAA
jgi:hypothetical protein